MSNNSHAMALCWAASQGDVSELARMVANGVNLEEPDYDGRTALHLGASNGHLNAVQFLVNKKIDPNPKDRWNGTPMADAKREGHEEIYAFFKANGGTE